MLPLHNTRGFFNVCFKKNLATDYWFVRRHFQANKRLPALQTIGHKKFLQLRD
jgi:hypothetical protein